jgi:hypothetical protein
MKTTIAIQKRNKRVYSERPAVNFSQNTEEARKGYEFENYIVTLFDNKTGRFRLMEWRGDKIASNNVFPESNQYPDLEFSFRTKYGRHRFAVECKWRNSFYKGKIDWAREDQIKNYLNYEKEFNIPVFVAIGIGGLASAPEKLFVTPLRNISSYPEVFEHQLMVYKRHPQRRFFYDSFQLKLF